MLYIEDDELGKAYKKIPEVVAALERNEKQTTLLNPILMDADIGITKSKMGGTPNLSNFKTYPKCDVCQHDLNFIIQLFQVDFPDFYFPNDSRLFQVFRCPNESCSGNYNGIYDLKLFPYFFKGFRVKNHIDPPLPIVDSDEYEARMPPYALASKQASDFPYYADFGWNDKNILRTNYEELKKRINDEGIIDRFFTPQRGNKLWGYPSWIQNSVWPACSICAEDKTFFLQLSGEMDFVIRRDYKYVQGDPWSSYSSFINEWGHIYFFVCNDCGVDTIETRYDWS